jgi:putative membrane protein
MQKHSGEYLLLTLKGFAMGAANVIPGVSGGTIALITGIFERLIHSLKSIDHIALSFLLRGKLRLFSDRINFVFLFAVFSGAVISVFTLARLLGWLFDNYPVYIWSYFFGLILASVYFVGKTIGKWTFPVFLLFTLGAFLAVWISSMSPAQGNEGILYLVLCGIVAVCSMILPGLSGSFILILMGNYELVAIEAVNELRLEILMPVFVGIVIGLLAFSHFLSWIFTNFRDVTLAALTGIIAGSLVILWPWKDPVYRMSEIGTLILKPDGSPVIQNYRKFIPDSFSSEVIIAVILMIAGYLSIWLIEKIAAKRPEYSATQDIESR